jgi:hypothetical protein
VEELLKLLAAGLLGGGMTSFIKFSREWWVARREDKQVASKLTIEEREENQRLDQERESFNLREARRQIKDLYARLGEQVKESERNRAGRARCEIIHARTIEIMTERNVLTQDDRHRIYRPNEDWENEREKQREEEDDSVH